MPASNPVSAVLRSVAVLGALSILTLTTQLSGQDRSTASLLTKDGLCRHLSSSTNRYFGRSRADQDPSRTQPSATLASATLALEAGNFQATVNAVRPLLNHAAAGTREQANWLIGLAQLRRGETENCLGGNHPQTTDPASAAATCILPLRPEAQHHDPTAARDAAQAFLEVLELQPRHATAAWLANLAAGLAGQPDLVPERYRLQLTTPATEPSAAWRNIAPALGVDVTDLAGGAAIEDLDGDGRLDVITSTQDPCGGLTVFRNLGAAGFRDVTEAWGLATVAGGLNLFTADFDNDGRVDLFVTRGAWLLADGHIPNSMLRNTSGPNGAPAFRDVTDSLGLLDPAAPTQAAVFFDADNDGDLDLYLGNEATAARPNQSVLLRNDLDPASGSRRFTDITSRAGVANLRYAKAVASGDIDNDGDQDLYVSNFGLNRLYVNQLADSGNLRFVDRASELGLTEPAVQSFATWFFDFDQDGDEDLFVADYQQQPNQVAASYFAPDSWIGRRRGKGGQPLIYRNTLIENGQLGFEEVSHSLGVSRPAMPMGANYGDLDGDGSLDIYLGTGEPNLASQFPNQAYRFDGQDFVDVTLSSGLAHIQKGHGTAFGDLDNDGDQDLLHQLGGFYRGDPGANALFENLSQDRAATHRWLTLQLIGTRSNRFGVGARVRVRIRTAEGTLETLHRTVGTGGSFGANSLQLEIGLGQATSVDSVVVDWPGGTQQSFRGVALDATYRLTESDSTAKRIERQPFSFVADNQPTASQSAASEPVAAPQQSQHQPHP